MEAHQIRVIEEKKELDGKIDRLQKFMITKKFREELAHVDRSLMGKQLELMYSYSGILARRIARF